MKFSEDWNSIEDSDLNIYIVVRVSVQHRTLNNRADEIYFVNISVICNVIHMYV